MLNINSIEKDVAKHEGIGWSGWCEVGSPCGTGIIWRDGARWTGIRIWIESIWRRCYPSFVCRLCIDLFDSHSDVTVSYVFWNRHGLWQRRGLHGELWFALIHHLVKRKWMLSRCLALDCMTNISGVSAADSFSVSYLHRCWPRRTSIWWWTIELHGDVDILKDGQYWCFCSGYGQCVCGKIRLVTILMWRISAWRKRLVLDCRSKIPTSCLHEMK